MTGRHASRAENSELPASSPASGKPPPLAPSEPKLQTSQPCPPCHPNLEQEWTALEVHHQLQDLHAR